jgi:ribosome-binding protein aMBF1 (putative translation factor)
MNYCFKCEKTENETELLDAISKEGLVKVCKRCYIEEDIPLLKKPTDSQLEESQRRQSVYEKLSNMSGVKKDGDTSPKGLSAESVRAMRKQDVSLREIVEQNMKRKQEGYEKRVKERISPKKLIDNYNWAIMMARRKDKITKEKLAKEIGESISALDMLEKGFLPRDYERLVEKLESYFGVYFFKERKMPLNDKTNKEDKETTISDLRKISEGSEKDEDNKNQVSLDKGETGEDSIRFSQEFELEDLD